MSRCKCPKSDVPKRDEQCPPYFEDITTKMEERRCDLIGRHKHLREKITTMERSIPALIAYNMWMAKKCDDAPYCKVRQIMKKFAPHPDQTERLLGDLKKTVKDLNGETEELHEKIIQADVKLEETGMELESIELVNKEMNDTVNNLEGEVRRYTTPSLHSIHSEDVLCLTKIRELAEEELSLKHCIKDLEKKETIFKDHMDRLLTCKEYRNPCGRGKPIYCAQDLQCGGKKICWAPKKCLWQKQSGQKQNGQMQNGQMQMEETEEDTIVQVKVEASTSIETVNKAQDEAAEPAAPAENLEKRKSSWISNWWKNGQPSSESASQGKMILPDDSSSQKIADPSPETEKPTTVASPPDQKEEGKTRNKSAKLSKSAQCPRSCLNSKHLQRPAKSCVGKFTPACNVPCIIPCNMPCKIPLKGCAPKRHVCQLSRCATTDHGIRRGCNPFSIPCDHELRGLCEICPSMPCKGFSRPVGNCRCNCKGKCARGLSDVECNCSDEPLDASEQYQPTGSKQLADSRREESDDEFCECCSCGCEDSDENLLCQCN